MRKTALLLIAHGSRRAEANADPEWVAERLRSRGHPICVASYLELAAPSILEGGERCVQSGAEEVILAPYFLSAGRHVRSDLAHARQQLAELYPNVTFLLAEPLGPDELLVDVVERRALDVQRSQSNPNERS